METAGYFTPLPNPPFSPEHPRKLLDLGIMPATVVCIANRTERTFYRTLSRGGPGGFPVIDFPYLKSSLTPERFIAETLDRSFGFALPEDVVRVIPVLSPLSPVLPHIAHRGYEHIHRRAYIPCLVVTGARPTTDRLRPVPFTMPFPRTIPVNGHDPRHLAETHQAFVDTYVLRPRS
jgi:hypothetical protein